MTDKEVRAKYYVKMIGGPVDGDHIPDNLDMSKNTSYGVTDTVTQRVSGYLRVSNVKAIFITTRNTKAEAIADIQAYVNKIKSLR